MVLKEGLAVISEFADLKTFAALQNSVRDRLCGSRALIPEHNRGFIIPYAKILRSYPAVAKFYESRVVAERISNLAGVRLYKTPSHDPSSCSILIYDQPGNRIGGHGDHSFYNGRRFTALLPLVNEHLSAQLVVRKAGRRIIIPAPPNTLVVFEGDIVRHAVTALGPNEFRVILSMTFCTNPMKRPVRALRSRIQGSADIGVRALWT